VIILNPLPPHQAQLRTKEEELLDASRFDAHLLEASEHSNENILCSHLQTCSPRQAQLRTKEARAASMPTF
jgi:hypothetical protein